VNALWTSVAAANATGGTSPVDWFATGVSIDTRSLVPGDLFVALEDQRDGHDFVQEALAKGAGASMVSRHPSNVPADAPLLLVRDTLAGLEDLGREARSRHRGRVVAVTGSAGKTGTKEMLRTVLERLGSQVHASERSYNNHWGVPLTLARLRPEHDFAVVEIGMNAPGEIEPLARMARPHVALVTTVAPVHLAAFKDVDAIAREKASIFEGLEEGGYAVVNGDLSNSEILVRTAKSVTGRILRFGSGNGMDIRLVDCRTIGSRTMVDAVVMGKPISFELGSPGRHLAMNALGVLGCIEALGADVHLAAKALSEWQNAGGRGQQFSICVQGSEGPGTITLIDESYNANPTSMAVAFEVLAASSLPRAVSEPAIGRRVAFVGDMLELGSDEAGFHSQLAELEALANVDMVHCSGRLMRFFHEALPHAKQGVWSESSDVLAQRIAGLVEPGDVIMVKGSNASKMQRVVDAIKDLGQVRAGKSESV
jgi:UDP-N-acetylmuramoyl-tripeptide--D-alanyl-D-alanine ligase